MYTWDASVFSCSLRLGIIKRLHTRQPGGIIIGQRLPRTSGVDPQHAACKIEPVPQRCRPADAYKPLSMQHSELRHAPCVLPA